VKFQALVEIEIPDGGAPAHVKDVIDFVMQSRKEAIIMCPSTIIVEGYTCGAIANMKVLEEVNPCLIDAPAKTTKSTSKRSAKRKS